MRHKNFRGERDTTHRPGVRVLHICDGQWRYFFVNFLWSVSLVRAMHAAATKVSCLLDASRASPQPHPPRPRPAQPEAVAICECAVSSAGFSTLPKKDKQQLDVLHEASRIPLGCCLPPSLGDMDTVWMEVCDEEGRVKAKRRGEPQQSKT